MPDVLHLTLPEGRVPVRVSRKARTRISLRIANGEVKLAAPPGVPLAELQRILELRRDWIAQHWRAVPIVSEALPERVSLFGQALRPAPHEGKRRSVRRDGDMLWLAGAIEPAEQRALLAQWLAREAALYLPARTAALARHTGLIPREVKLANARGRWGSCTSAGVVRLNWRLVQAPVAISDYVIVHELAHLQHMNHSAAFWALVGRHCPEWQARRDWLKQHSAELFEIG
ncbi:SprT family zinc-dependent metalloprotease [Crenobacter sp. SG2305]|uniref:M48 family metallopeptidase n=1 Tax=Crenobacter oryzisoli TaxID=3056844 RepID=UPI0025AA7AA9|nr:SprT family zinc-dependent metalloprotease [Crenobacter sp. SG2305]MDN0081484.1 SprT family zinc-dependent metalloprotease [Crenobacter sp. SG2305]